MTLSQRIKSPRSLSLTLCAVALLLLARGCCSTTETRPSDDPVLRRSQQAYSTAGQQQTYSRQLHVAEAPSNTNARSNTSSGSSSSSGSTGSSVAMQNVEWHWDVPDIGTLAVASVNFFLAAATGQGGTALLIPIFTSMLKMSVSQAVSCAVFVIFLGSIPSVWHALTMDHPYDTSLTLIDYRTMSILTPSMLLGIKAGVALNKMSPDWFVSFLLIFTYTLSTYKQMENMIKLRAQEARLARVMKRVKQDIFDLETAASFTSTLQGPTATTGDSVSLHPGQLEPQLQVQLLQEWHEERRRQTLSELESNIQQVAELSRDMLEKEAYTLPPQSLDKTPNTAIQSALNQHHWRANSPHTNSQGLATARVSISGAFEQQQQQGQGVGFRRHSDSPARRPSSNGGGAGPWGLCSHNSGSSTSFTAVVHRNNGIVGTDGLTATAAEGQQRDGNAVQPMCTATPDGTSPTAAACAAALGSTDLRSAQPVKQISTPDRSSSDNLGPGTTLPDHTGAARSRQQSAANQQRQHSWELPQLTSQLSGLTEDQLLHLGHSLASASPCITRTSSLLNCDLPAGCNLEDISVHPGHMLHSRPGSCSGMSPKGLSPRSCGGRSPRGLSPLGLSPKGQSPRGLSPRSSGGLGSPFRRGIATVPEESEAAGPAAADGAAAATPAAVVDLVDCRQAARVSSSSSGSSSGLDSDSDCSSSSSSSTEAGKFNSLSSPFPMVQLVQAQAQSGHCPEVAGSGSTVGPHQQLLQHQLDAACLEQQQELLAEEVQQPPKNWPAAAAGLGAKQSSRCNWARRQKQQRFCCCYAAYQQQQQQQQYSLCDKVQGLIGAVQIWWQKQPHLLLSLITVNFVAYLLLCVGWGWLPKCHAGFYALTAAYIAASVGLAVWVCYLHWPRRQQQRQVTLAGSLVGAAAAAADGRCSLGKDSGLRTVGTTSKAAGCKPTSPNDSAATVQDTMKDCPNSSSKPAKDSALDVSTMFQEINWTRKRLLYFQPLMLAIGMVSGLLGASPNTLFLTPMLVTLGQHPQVASATLKLALFISMGSSSMGFMVNGQLDMSHGLAFGIANLIITPLGQWVMDVWIQKTGRSSLILVAGVLRNLVALPLLFVFNGVPAVLDLMHTTNVHFSMNFCS